MQADRAFAKLSRVSYVVDRVQRVDGNGILGA